MIYFHFPHKKIRSLEDRYGIRRLYKQRLCALGIHGALACKNFIDSLSLCGVSRRVIAIEFKNFFIYNRKGMRFL